MDAQHCALFRLYASAVLAMSGLPMGPRMQDKLAGDARNKQIREIYKDLVDECLARPPSAEDANSIAGELAPRFLARLSLSHSSDGNEPAHAKLAPSWRGEQP